MLFSLFHAGVISLGLLAATDVQAVDTLGAATVTADKGVIVSRVDKISTKQSISVSDALSLSSGIYVGDNGGLAGLKTVNLRGLGSAHTAIYLDGVRVGNVQSDCRRL